MSGRLEYELCLENDFGVGQSQVAWKDKFLYLNGLIYQQSLNVTRFRFNQLDWDM